MDTMTWQLRRVFTRKRRKERDIARIKNIRYCATPTEVKEATHAKTLDLLCFCRPMYIMP